MRLHIPTLTYSTTENLHYTFISFLQLHVSYIYHTYAVEKPRMLAVPIVVVVEFHFPRYHANSYNRGFLYEII